MRVRGALLLPGQRDVVLELGRRRRRLLQPRRPRSRGWELKHQLVRASIEAIERFARTAPQARFVQCDPLIHIVPDSPRAVDQERAEGHRLAQFQAWDMLAGRQWPGLGGCEGYLDIIGANFYPQNQWRQNGERILLGHPEFRPLAGLLAELNRRYGRPILLAETGAEADARGPWLEYVGEQLRWQLRVASMCRGCAGIRSWTIPVGTMAATAPPVYTAQPTVKAQGRPIIRCGCNCKRWSACTVVGNNPPHPIHTSAAPRRGSRRCYRNFVCPPRRVTRMCGTRMPPPSRAAQYLPERMPPPGTHNPCSSGASASGHTAQYLPERMPPQGTHNPCSSGASRVRPHRAIPAGNACRPKGTHNPCSSGASRVRPHRAIPAGTHAAPKARTTPVAAAQAASGQTAQYLADQMRNPPTSCCNRAASCSKRRTGAQGGFQVTDTLLVEQVDLADVQVQRLDHRCLLFGRRGPRTDSGHRFHRCARSRWSGARRPARRLPCCGHSAVGFLHQRHGIARTTLQLLDHLLNLLRRALTYGWPGSAPRRPPRQTRARLHRRAPLRWRH